MLPVLRSQSCSLSCWWKRYSQEVSLFKFPPMLFKMRKNNWFRWSGLQILCSGNRSLWKTCPSWVFKQIVFLKDAILKLWMLLRIWSLTCKKTFYLFFFFNLYMVKKKHNKLNSMFLLYILLYILFFFSFFFSHNLPLPPEEVSMSFSCIYLKIKRFSKGSEEHICSIFRTKIMITFEILQLLETIWSYFLLHQGVLALCFLPQLLSHKSYCPCE